MSIVIAHFSPEGSNCGRRTGRRTRVRYAHKEERRIDPRKDIACATVMPGMALQYSEVKGFTSPRDKTEKKELARFLGFFVLTSLNDFYNQSFREPVRGEL